MKQYLGIKKVMAEPMNEQAAVEKGFARKNTDSHEWRDGYHVQYTNPDGSTYDSWSPKDVFERAYNELQEGQVVMTCFSMSKRDINRAISLMTIGGAREEEIDETTKALDRIADKGYVIVPEKVLEGNKDVEQFKMLLPLLAVGTTL